MKFYVSFLLALSFQVSVLEFTVPWMANPPQVTDSSHPEPCDCLIVDGTPSFVHFSIVVPSPSQRLRPAENCRNNLHCLTVSKLPFLCGDVCRSPFPGLFTFSGTFLWPFLRLFLFAKVLFDFPRAVWLDTESWVPTFCSAS